MSNDAHRISQLEAENYRLAERVKALEAQLGFDRKIPRLFRLTPNETMMFRLLVERDEVSRDGALDILYGHRPEVDEPDRRVLDVYVHKTRKKIRPFGLDIETIWGVGWAMTGEAKAKVAEYLAAEVGNGG